MPFSHGKSAKVLVDEFDLTAWFSNLATPRSVDMADTTVFGNTVKTYLPGQVDGSLSLDGLWDGAAAAVDAVFSPRVGQDADVLFMVSRTSFVLGQPVWILGAKQTKYDVVASITDAVRIAVMAQGGGPYRALSLHDEIAESATANGTAIDNGAATAFGGIGQIHVVANSRNSGSGVFKVQHSVDNITFADLITFTSVPFGTITKEQIAVATGTTVNRYVRAQWTPNGTTGTVTFVMAFHRRTF